MHRHIQKMKLAAVRENGLEEAVKQVLSSMNLPTEVEWILDGLHDFAWKDPRYLRIYDLLHDRYPGNPVITFCKAVITHIRYREISVDAFIKTLLILHQTDEDYGLIRSCYNSLAVQYYNLDRPDQAIAACTLALSYYDPATDVFQHAIHSGLHLRATIYLEQGQPELAIKDVDYYLEHFPDDSFYYELKSRIVAAMYE